MTSGAIFTVGCQDPFDVHRDRYANGGLYTPVLSSDACAVACRTSQSTCYAFDWDRSGMCFLHLNPISEMLYRSGVSLYKRRFLCNPQPPPITTLLPPGRTVITKYLISSLLSSLENLSLQYLLKY